MITTKGVYHIGIPVNDVKRAVKFYTEILGMTIAKLNRDDMGDHLNRADLRVKYLEELVIDLSNFREFSLSCRLVQWRQKIQKLFEVAGVISQGVCADVAFVTQVFQELLDQLFHSQLPAG